LYASSGDPTLKARDEAGFDRYFYFSTYRTIQQLTGNELSMDEKGRKEIIKAAERVFGFTEREWLRLMAFRKKGSEEVHSLLSKEEELRELLDYLPKEFVADRSVFEKLIEGLDISGEE
jgi:hypothetical protein